VCGPVITGLGDACTAPNGCPGTRTCNSTGTGTDCTTQQTKNECGVCGGPPVAGVGTSCSSSDGCPGQLVCNGSGTGTVCNAPNKNQCNVCGPPVNGLGGSCTTTQGCSGTVMCNSSGTAGECVSMLTPNECGLCGGAPVTGLGSACTDGSGCAGTLACNSTKDGTVCNASCVTTNYVVISEVSLSGSAGNDDEFIELYNPTGSPISLSGHTLYYRSASGTTWNEVHTFSSTAQIKARGYFLLGGLAYPSSATADARFTQLLGNSGGQIWLWKGTSAPTSSVTPTHTNVVDMLGYGSASVHEGAAAASVSASGGSMERKASASSTATTMVAGGADELKGNGYDSNHNGNDFVVRTTRQPQHSGSPSEP
ncbi:MAG: lamin tail domain-containing protein, partial [Myxococcales bacterium]